MRITGLIAAAGESVRMGQCKALLQLGSTTFVQHLETTLKLVCRDVLVTVSDHNGATIKQHLHQRTDLIKNCWPERGLLGSVQSALLADKACEALIVCPVDAPFITHDLLQELVQAWQEHEPCFVLPTFQGQHGHPVLIGREGFGVVLALGPTLSLRDAIRNSGPSTRLVDWPDASVLANINTPRAYQQISALGFGTHKTFAQDF